MSPRFRRRLRAASSCLAAVDGAAAWPAAPAASGRGRGTRAAEPWSPSFYPLQFADAADRRRPCRGPGPHQARRRAARPRADAAGRRRREQGATSWSTRRASSRPSTRPSTSEAPDRALDVAAAANLDLTFTRIEPGGPTPQHRRRRGSTDPHFWLDPMRYAAVAEAVADRLMRRRPGPRGPTTPPTPRPSGPGCPRSTASCRTGLAHCAKHLDRHQPQRLRLPRPALRPDPGRHHRALPRGRAGAAPSSPRSPDFVRAHHVTRSTPRRWSARTSPTRWPGRPGRGWPTLDPIEGLTDRLRRPRLLRGHALQPRDAARRPGVLVSDRGGSAPAVLSLRCGRASATTTGRPSPTSTSTCRPARSWPCSGRTARASPPWCGACSA